MTVGGHGSVRLYMYALRVGVYVFYGVCLSVCLFVVWSTGGAMDFRSDHRTTTDWLSTYTAPPPPFCPLHLGELSHDGGVPGASVLSSKRDACLGNLCRNEREMIKFKHDGTTHRLHTCGSEPKGKGSAARMNKTLQTNRRAGVTYVERFGKATQWARRKYLPANAPCCGPTPWSASQRTR